MTRNLRAHNAEDGIDAFIAKRKPVWRDAWRPERDDYAMIRLAGIATLGALKKQNANLHLAYAARHVNPRLGRIRAERPPAACYRLFSGLERWVFQRLGPDLFLSRACARGWLRSSRRGAVR
jgi:hypothetical protein